MSVPGSSTNVDPFPTVLPYFSTVLMPSLSVYPPPRFALLSLKK